MEERPKQPEPLGYETPQTRQDPDVSKRFYALAAFAGCLGLIAALCAAFMLSYGVIAVIGMIKDGGPVEAGDVFGVTLWNLIGIIAAVLAVRWIRFAVRSPRSEVALAPDESRG